jgi:hypothetical protein
VDVGLKPLSRSSPREDFRAEEEEGKESDRWREDDDFRSSSSLRRLLLLVLEVDSLGFPMVLLHILQDWNSSIRFGLIECSFGNSLHGSNRCVDALRDSQFQIGWLPRYFVQQPSRAMPREQKHVEISQGWGQTRVSGICFKVNS